MKLDNSTVSNSARRVKSKRKAISAAAPKTLTATQLIPVLLRRGEREEFFHVPICHACHEPVLDFEEANVVVIGHDWTDCLESLETLDGAELSRLPGTAVVVHIACDQREWKPWIRATSVFCQDQRRAGVDL